MTDSISSETVVELVSEYGTPLYITDLDAVQSRYEGLQQTLDFCTVKYACKSNFDPQVLTTLAETDDDIEFVCGSSYEALVARKENIRAGRLQVTAVSPKTESINHLVQLSYESSEFTTTINEIETLRQLLDSGYRGNVLLRLPPDRSLQSDSKYANGSRLKFGLTDSEVQTALVLLEGSAATFTGFHSHLGGSFLTDSIEKYCQHIEQTIELATTFCPLEEIQELNFGGGLGIPYEPDTPELDVELLGDSIKEVLPESTDTEFIIEPGRYIVGPTTILATEVQTTRERDGNRFVGVDAGMAEFPRPTMFDVYHHIEPVTTSIDEVVEQTIAGPTCSGADIFGSKREFMKVEAGDILQVEDVGAYGFVMANHFHAYPSPTIVSTEGDKSPSLEEIVDMSDFL